MRSVHGGGGRKRVVLSVHGQQMSPLRETARATTPASTSPPAVNTQHPYNPEKIMNDQYFLIDRQADAAYGPFPTITAANEFAQREGIYQGYLPGIGTTGYVSDTDLDVNTTVVIPNPSLAA